MGKKPDMGVHAPPLVAQRSWGGKREAVMVVFHFSADEIKYYVARFTFHLSARYGNLSLVVLVTRTSCAFYVRTQI